MNQTFSPKEVKAQYQFSYKGNIWPITLWFLWSIVGHLILVIESESHGALEYLYLISALVSAMAINNRYHGVNHTIRFFDKSVVIPAPFSSWKWSEEHIPYEDIKEIKVIRQGSDAGEIVQMIIRTAHQYIPIVSTKLEADALKEIRKIFLSKSKIPLKTESVTDYSLGGNQDKDASSNSDKANSVSIPRWKKALILLSLLIGVWAIVAITYSTPYLNVLYGGKIFLISFVVALFGMLNIILFLRKSNVETSSEEKISENKNPSMTWQKIFFVVYLGIYGGLAMAFSLVWINGAWDSADSTKVVLQVVSKGEESGQYCITLNVPLNHSENVARVNSLVRAPASEWKFNEPQVPDYFLPIWPLTFCRKDLPALVEGENLILHTHPGMFGEPWVSRIEKL